MEQASPQLENGYTRIANELLEAFKNYPFKAIELRIIIFLIRQTYGWKRKKTIISYGMIARDLGTDIRYIKRIVAKLVQDKVILKEKSGKENVLGLNKDYKSWRLWKTVEPDTKQTTTSVAISPPG